VAITGASGAVYGLRLAGELLSRGDDVELVISPSGFLLLAEELGIKCDRNDGSAAAAYIEDMATRAQARKGGLAPRRGALRYHASDDLTSAIASGSSLRRAMVIAPCSMGTLARVASGISANLIERAADCVLKERGTLVLVPRETPLSSIHLENMLKLSRMGAVILPAMPAFYTHPETIDDMVDFVIGKTLDILGVENDLYKRWKK